jgi:ABC-type sugar transport system substrate-binding protein
MEMASQQEIELIVGKAILNPEFRKELMNSPEAAAKKMGIELTLEQTKAFKAHDFGAVAKQIEQIESKMLLLFPYNG